MKRLLLPLLAVTAVACAAPKPEAKAPVKPAAPVVATAAAPAVPVESKPKVEPIPAAIASLAAEAKKCAFGQFGFDFSCDALKEWEEEEDAFADGKGDEALMTMLASTETKDRFLAADRLATFMGSGLSEEHAADPSFADRILAAAAKEKKPVVARRMALVVSHLDLVGSERLGRAVELAKSHRLEEYREEFALTAGVFASSRGEELLAWGEELTKGTSHELGRAIVSRFTREADFGDRACRDLSALRKDADPFVVSSVMMDLASSPACRQFHEAVIKDVAAIDLGKTEGPRMRLGPALAMSSICSDPDTTTALKAKALAQAKRITDAKTPPSYVRSTALSAIAACDPKAGAAYASKFAKDKDLASTAKWISARSAKK